MKKAILLIILFASIVSSINAQTEKQDTIKTDAKTKEFIDSIYGSQLDNRFFGESPVTPGDYLKFSGKLRLAGLGLSITTSTLFFTGAFNELELSLQEQRIVAIISGIVSLGLYIGGEVCLIKAGKLMNEERVTLSPASESIGLAINF